jgi:hypothetical protein
MMIDHELRRTMGKTGCYMVRESFSWDAKAIEILKVYESVLNARRKDPGS